MLSFDVFVLAAQSQWTQYLPTLKLSFSLVIRPYPDFRTSYISIGLRKSLCAFLLSFPFTGLQRHHFSGWNSLSACSSGLESSAPGHDWGLSQGCSERTGQKCLDVTHPLGRTLSKWGMGDGVPISQLLRPSGKVSPRFPQALPWHKFSVAQDIAHLITHRFRLPFLSHIMPPLPC